MPDSRDASGLPPRRPSLPPRRPGAAPDSGQRSPKGDEAAGAEHSARPVDANAETEQLGPRRPSVRRIWPKRKAAGRDTVLPATRAESGDDAPTKRSAQRDDAPKKRPAERDGEPAKRPAERDGASTRYPAQRDGEPAKRPAQRDDGQPLQRAESRDGAQRAKRPDRQSAAASRADRPGRQRSRRGDDRNEPVRVSTKDHLRVSWMFLTLVAVVLIGAFTLSPSISLLIEQRSEIDAVRGEIDETNASIDELQREVANWSDPAYVQAQARERLFYVMPGEQAFTIIDDRDGVPEVDDTSIVADELVTQEVDWATVGFRSVMMAGVTELTPEQLRNNAVVVEE